MWYLRDWPLSYSPVFSRLELILLQLAIFSCFNWLQTFQSVCSSGKHFVSLPAVPVPQRPAESPKHEAAWAHPVDMTAGPGLSCDQHVSTLEAQIAFCECVMTDFWDLRAKSGSEKQKINSYVEWSVAQHCSICTWLDMCAGWRVNRSYSAYTFLPCHGYYRLTLCYTSKSHRCIVLFTREDSS